MKRKNYQRKSFVNQSTRLVTHYPEHKDEILDYVSQLNTKWDQVAHTMAPKRSISGDCSFNMRKGIVYVVNNELFTLYILHFYVLFFQ